MTRQPRLDLPGIPQHIVQRGNNHLPRFLDAVDRQHYLTLLGEALLDTGCRLYAYVLMDNHVHLLTTPPEVDVIARLMQKLGRDYVSRINVRPTDRNPVGRLLQSQPSQQRKLHILVPPIVNVLVRSRPEYPRQLQQRAALRNVP